jgi:hypothetical protein
MHAESGPLWLHGYFFSSGWERAALLLIAVAVAVGVRSLILIGRGAKYGLGSTVSGLVIASTALVVGNAILVGLLGVAASFVVYGKFAGARRSLVTAAGLVAFIVLALTAILLVFIWLLSQIEWA